MNLLSRIPSLFRSQAAETKPDDDAPATKEGSSRSSIETPKPKLVQRLGGAAAVTAVVDIFYAKLMADEQIVPFFEGVDMKKQKAKQAQFMTYVFGGPEGYKGRDLRAAHLPLIRDKGLNETHFNMVAGHLASSLKEAGVPQDLVDEVIGIVATTKDVIFNPAPGELEADKATADVAAKPSSPAKRCPFTGATAPAEAVASCPGAAMAAAAAVEEAAAPAAEPSPEPLIARLGGHGAVKAVVDLFYDRLMADGQLSPFFDGVDMKKQRAKQAQFMNYVFGAREAYKGRDLRAAHLPLIRDKGLNETHFNMVAGHLSGALAEAGVPQPLIDEVIGIVATTKDVIFKPAPGEVEATA